MSGIWPHLTAPLRKLWVHLAIAYSMLSFAGMALLMLLTGTFFNFANFNSTFTAQNIGDLLDSEMHQAGYALQIPDLPQSERQAIADRIRAALLKLQMPGVDQDIFQLTAVSQPVVHVSVLDAGMRQFSRSPSGTSDPGQNTEARHTIVVEREIKDGSGGIIGAATVVFTARYNWWTNVLGNLRWIMEMWFVILVTSAFTGTICGMVAARYLVRRLAKMNAVTAEWSRGNFATMIAFENSDELSVHSQRLNAMARELQGHLKLRQVMAITEERNRMARDLHDTVKQKLFALGLQMSTARLKLGSGHPAEDNIEESLAINREVQNDLVGIIGQLRPSDIGNVPFPDQLEQVLSSARRRLGIDVEFDPSTMPEMEIATGNHLLRITEEALSNAVRHGGARSVTVRYRDDEGRCRYCVTDDGNGFDVERTRPGMGLQSIRERAGELPSGSFVIKSLSGAGTTLTVSWDLEQE
jgi:two-component system, NarL family, sensor histidine kinase LiaS